ncbi:hypothetical protein C5167_049959 [Papaver somniferum]|uniref:DUF676 domain-containing protein n=1 Tax=Papaver somniferum TaxID=3469 RepID=A0A4Y7KR86_PAPSO|nr:uncharacterized protein LOC113303027 isoform X1 [Papaver somniferum]RZC74479.1 hypothetical protein C5167_049959 [Papaver somniferum]
MDRWNGVLRVSLNPDSRCYFKIAVSVCFSSSSKTLTVPTTNAIFFNGDKIQGTGTAVIEKLSNLQNIADILVSKLGVSDNVWVIEASNFNGPFAVYNDFFGSINSYGEPKSYDPSGFPSSASTSLLLLRALKEAKRQILGEQEHVPTLGDDASCFNQPETIMIIFGFSKGGTVLNQLVTELALSKLETLEMGTKKREDSRAVSTYEIHGENHIIPNSKEELLNSISQFHYVDVGLNSAGAYLTDSLVIERIVKQVLEGVAGIRFVLHGTPRQWCDNRRAWIRDEMEKLFQLLQDAELKTEGKLQAVKRIYFTDQPPNLQMHFEIIENLDIG